MVHPGDGRGRSNLLELLPFGDCFALPCTKRCMAMLAMTSFVSELGSRLGRGTLSEQIVNQIDNVTCRDMAIAVGISRLQRTRTTG
jgi:hypothetical protein